MTALDWISAALGGWLVLSVLGTAGVARAAHVLKGRRRAAPPAYPPVVPEPADEWDRFLRLINEDAA